MVKLAWPLALPISGGDAGARVVCGLGAARPHASSVTRGQTWWNCTKRRREGVAERRAPGCKSASFIEHPSAALSGPSHRSDPQRAMLLAFSRLH